MAITIMMQEDGVDQGETLTVSFECDDEDWEEECYQLGCKVAREVAIRVLGTMEERLFQQRPKDWEVEDTKRRTRVTRFGEIPVWRRLYKDEEGSYHFLLDEYLNWITYRRATSSPRFNRWLWLSCLPKLPSGKRVRHWRDLQQVFYRSLQSTGCCRRCLKLPLKVRRRNGKLALKKGSYPHLEKGKHVCFTQKRMVCACVFSGKGSRSIMN